MASPYPTTREARNVARNEARANRRNTSPSPPGIPEQGSPLAPPPNIRDELLTEEDENGGDTLPYTGEYDNPPSYFEVDEIASMAEEELGELVEDGTLIDQEILPPLEIEPTSIINDNEKGYTYADIVKLLQPLTPNPGDKAEPVCQEVHKLMGKDESEKAKRMQEIFKVFSEIVGEDTIQELINDKYDTDNKQEVLRRIALVFYKMILILLGKHNADEASDADSHVFDNVSHRETLARHAVFHIAKVQIGEYVETLAEGIIHHPYFTAEPSYLLIIMMFILDLPTQVQVFWAQYYITAFISGYGQTLEDFNPILRGPYGFIAS